MHKTPKFTKNKQMEHPGPQSNKTITGHAPKTFK
jgi:hypothetical protein